MQAVAGEVRQAGEMSAAVSGRWPAATDASSDVAVFCACESDSSATLGVRCAGAPTTPRLRVDNMDENGVDVAWDMFDHTDSDDDVTVSRTVSHNKIHPLEQIPLFPE